MKLPLEGGCRCDRVRIRLTKPPLMETACHCRGCQRMSASAFSLTAICLADGFEVIAGQPVLGGLKNPDVAHYACPDCLSWMFTRPGGLPHIVNVRPTMFDDHAWFSPYMETFTKTKLPWATTGAVVSFEEFPAMDAYEGLMKAYVARRNPAG